MTGCMEDEARAMYAETQDTVEAIDRLLARPPNTTPMPRKFKRTDKTSDEAEVERIRDTMVQVDKNIELAIAARHGASESAVTQVLLEETAPQNNCSQECHLPSFEEVVETSGKACR